MSEARLLDELQAIANKHFDGHFTVMKFTTNWRVGFRTPMACCDIDQMWSGDTFDEAASEAIAGFSRGEHKSPDCHTHDWLRDEGVKGECPYCHEAIDPLEAA
jgi:hypothetical protein